MPPNYCPDCGTAVLETNASFCEECGCEFDNESGGEEHDLWNGDAGVDPGVGLFDSARADVVESHTPPLEGLKSRDSRHEISQWAVVRAFLQKAFVGVVMVVGFVVGYLGGLGLFIWALVLLNEHWGLFWAALGLFTMFFALVVVVMCFFWGVPYFFFASLACVAAIAAIGSLESSKRGAAVALLGVLAFGATGGYLAWNDLTTPDPITAREMDRLTDDAIAVIAVLRSTENPEDAEAAIASTRAKGRLRDELRKYDTVRLDAIEAMVTQYLNFEKAIERDLLGAVERRARGERVAFEMSLETRTAMERMPERMQKVFSVHLQDFDALNFLFEDVDLDDLPDKWREGLTFSLDKRWKHYAVAYEDVMRRPMPTSE